MRQSTFITVICLVITTSLGGCNQDVTDPDDNTIKSVEVVYGDVAVEVDLAEIEEVEREGEPYARLSDVVAAADLGVPLGGLEFDFEASDGFRSSSTSTCVDVIPMAGEMLEQGYVHMITRNLDFEADLELPGCVTSLRDLARILASDAVPTVEVEYDDDTTTVDLAAAEVVEFEGADHVRLTDIVALADLGAELDALAFDFEASDGFRPSQSDNCTDVMPLAGDLMTHGYVSLASGDLSWAEEADLPGCLNLVDLALIVATDASIGPFVDIIFDGETTTVDLGQATVVNFEGNDAVALTEVIELAEIGVATADLSFDFLASDGYRPSENVNCSSIMPIAGDQLGDAFIRLANRNLVWNPSAGLPGCAYVNDLAQIDALSL